MGFIIHYLVGNSSRNVSWILIPPSMRKKMTICSVWWKGKVWCSDACMNLSFIGSTSIKKCPTCYLFIEDSCVQTERCKNIKSLQLLDIFPMLWGFHQDSEPFSESACPKTLSVTYRMLQIDSITLPAAVNWLWAHIMCQVCLLTFSFRPPLLGISRSNGMKLSKGKFRLNIRKIFLTVRSIRMWNSPPGKTMEALLLESLKIDWKKTQ